MLNNQEAQSRYDPSRLADLLDELELLFGYNREDLEKIMLPMIEGGEEPVSSMGTDTPLAVFSDKPQRLYNYFKQVFAQVTNPATTITPAPPPGASTLTFSKKPTCCVASSGEDETRRGRRPTRRLISATRAARFAERIEKYVVPARARVPPAVASDEMTTQSAMDDDPTAPR